MSSNKHKILTQDNTNTEKQHKISKSCDRNMLSSNSIDELANKYTTIEQHRIHIPNSFPPDRNYGVKNIVSSNYDEDSPLTPVDEIPLISNDWTSSDDTLDDAVYSPKSNKESLLRIDSSYDGTIGSPWTSNIDDQSPSNDSDRNEESKSYKKDKRSSSMNNVVGSLDFKFSSSDSCNSISGLKNSCTYNNVDNQINIPRVDNTQQSEPHAHFRLFQKRLNKLVFNVEHLSFIYKRKLNKK